MQGIFKTVKNPFSDFQPERYHKIEHNAERVMRVKEGVINALVNSYRGIVDKETNNLAWMVEHEHVVKVYEKIVIATQGLVCSAGDIEAFCSVIDNAEEIPLRVPGPLGLYLAALINHCPEKKLVLRISDYQRSFHFLGYHLPKNKILILDGNAGDFTGSAMCGGSLIIHGSGGDWCGAGMLSGELRIHKNAGQMTGEWMHGGVIKVQGLIESIGQNRFGGEIFQHGKAVGLNNPGNLP